jgi:hypothetical protein
VTPATSQADLGEAKEQAAELGEAQDGAVPHAQDPELGEAKDGGATQVNPLSLHLQTDLAGRTVQRTVRKNSNGGL